MGIHLHHVLTLNNVSVCPRLWLMGRVSVTESLRSTARSTYGTRNLWHLEVGESAAGTQTAPHQRGNAVLDLHHTLYRNKAFQHLWQESHQLPYVTLLCIC